MKGEPTQNPLDLLYREACDLIDGLLILQNAEPPPLEPSERERLRQAIQRFEQLIRQAPGHWPALWLLGKVHQRLGSFERGLECFAEAHRINPHHPDVAREASIAAMDAGQPERAIAFCERAIAVKPSDAGLLANLALAQLFSGRPAEASATADEALRQSPSDEITAMIAMVARQVLDGDRPCPRHVRDLAD